ncbi:DsrH/TusB family sulfur metabolism protein [Methanobacterium congolense]|uniref:DsrH family protein n=1 Tax=Methanobacterium congolense TaxID=118062 RepID=A0A1D3L5I3_9EURY|nr:DsrH/TusB family sulfur metabolism protein [Methanobacterium congolense]SCG86806.1 DsrH family protein [Methanobacterium congolense]
MHVGFLVTKTPGETGFKTFLNLVNLYVGRDEITIFFLGNGAYCARKGHKSGLSIKIIKNSRVKALRHDLTARGIRDDEVMEGVEIMQGYDEMVHEIMEEFDQVLSF